MNAIPPAKCPKTNPDELNCPLRTSKVGQIIDANGCLIWTCVPLQPYCCPFSSSETIFCGNELAIGRTLDPNTGCESIACVPKQPYCCRTTVSSVRNCLSPNLNADIYDHTSGCLVDACFSVCKIQMRGDCPPGTKPGLVVNKLESCLVWSCVPDQPICCPQSMESTESVSPICSDDSNLKQIMDPKTGCQIWYCVPKQPYCCKQTFPIRKCKKYTYPGQVYDLKTGCLI